MDFTCACLLLILWYVRPQDIFDSISGVSLVKYLMYVGIVATIRRHAGFSFGRLFAVPIDFLVVSYCLWAVYATDDHTAAAKEVFTYFSFHVLTALALSSWGRIEIYLNWWMVCLGTVATLAVSSHLGIELVKGSSELTALFHERLTLNTWIFRNPNALGHGVVALIPAGISWFVLFGSKNRIWGTMLLIVGAYCVVLTESKGAFLAGAGALTLVLLFRRPLAVQVIALVLGSGAGLAAVKMLPRMDTLSKSDEGIQGRMIVWQQAKVSMESTKTGEGLKRFEGYVEVRFAKLHRTIRVPIATHGSYVRHGADLGYIGLMLYGGIFYAGFRTVVQCRCPKGGLPYRVQRTLFGLLITATLSAWVVDRAYHMDYFLLSGLVSAFHRRFIPQPNGDSTGVAEQIGDEIHGGAVEEGGGGRGGLRLLGLRGTDDLRPDPDDAARFELTWQRLGVLDVAAMYVLLEVVLYYWELLSTDFVAF